MKYYSTNRQSQPVSLKEAVTMCIPSDGGLYMPSVLPCLPTAFFNNMNAMSLQEIAYVTSNIFIGEDIGSELVKEIVDETFSFEIPLKKLSDNRYILELYHGPTHAFKDIGARFLARLIRTILSDNKSKTNIIVTSNGNTGPATSSAFKDIKNTNVFILYPHGICPKESNTADNIYNIEVGGSIDDCKNMVAGLFADQGLRENAIFTSANSTNIARLIPQTAVFFYTCAKLSQLGINPLDVDFALPCGNMSALTSCIMSKKMGLKCGNIIAANTANNSFEIFLNSGNLPERQTTATLARFLDISTPSNIPRISDLYQGDKNSLNSFLQATSISDGEIKATIKNVYESFGYIADPQAAVALASLETRQAKNKIGVAFATVHPSKSKQTIESIIGRQIDKNTNTPNAGRHSAVIKMAPTYPALRKFIISKQ